MSCNINDTPEGWAKGKIGDTANLGQNRSRSGSFPYLEIGDIDIETKRYLVKDKPAPGICLEAHKSDTIVSKVRPTRGAISYILDDILYVSPAFSVLRGLTINNKLLFYYLSKEDLTRYLGSIETGTAYPSCNDIDILNYQIIYPKSSTEQVKIAEIISTCDKVIENTEKRIQKLKRIKDGLMQDLFRYGIDDQGQIRSETTHHFKDSTFGRIPDQWRVVELGTHSRKGGGSIQTGPFGSQLHAVDYVEDGIPIITVEHLNDGKIAHEYVPRVNEYDYKRLIKYSLEEGDSVYSRVGAIDRCSYVSRHEDGWLFSGRCLRVRPGKLLNPKFLSYLLSSHYPRTWILNNAVGSTMKCLNTAILSALPISIPSDKNEQSSIASVLTSIDEVIDKEEIYRQKLIDQKHGIMEDLLSGAVRVDHLIDKN